MYESLKRKLPFFMGCHGNSVNNTNAIKTKHFLRDPQMDVYRLSKFDFNSSCHSGVSRGFTEPPPPPLGQGVGKKHLGRARVNILYTDKFVAVIWILLFVWILHRKQLLCTFGSQFYHQTWIVEHVLFESMETSYDQLRTLHRILQFIN